MKRKFLSSHSLITGTLFLTAAGFLSRILGFFYRIFLSRTIGAEGMGLYQMIFPVYGICFSLCAGSIQTAISRFTAAEKENSRPILLSGLLLSFSIAIPLSVFVATQADWIAVHILMEPNCTPLLRTLTLAIPCTALHACICGYFYGKEKVLVPAVSQLIEQCIRIFTVYVVTDLCLRQNIPVTARIAVFGLTAGEAGSALFALFSFGITRTVPSNRLKLSKAPWIGLSSLRSVIPSLSTLALPLMANRLIMNLMQSAEAVLIPNRLECFGLTGEQAVSAYGVLTGMAMPFIMFPSAITNSLSVVLLPTVARQQSDGNHASIQNSLSMSSRYSLYMGILCIGIFTKFGESLGNTVFQNAEAGTLITILAWLCPFLYLATTMGSILNGLGKTTVTFSHNVLFLLIRLAFVFFGIPKLGMLACLLGMLTAEVVLVLLHAHALCRLTGFLPDAWETIVKPAFCLLAALGIFRLFPEALPFPLPGTASRLFTLAVQIGFVCLVYGLLLLLFHRPKSAADGS